MTHGACHVDYWDPHQSTIACGSAGFSPVYSQIMMWKHSDPLQLVGDLAQSWEWSDDGMQLTINIHEAMWSDGESVNADDLVFSLDRMVDPVPPKPRAQSINPYYERSEAIDDRTLVIHTKVPNPPGLLQYLALDYMKIMQSTYLSPRVLTLPTMKARERWASSTSYPRTSWPPVPSWWTSTSGERATV